MPKSSASPKGSSKHKTSDQALLKTGWGALRTSSHTLNAVLKNAGVSGVTVKQLFNHPTSSRSHDALRAMILLYKWRPDRGDKVRWNPSKAPESFAGGTTLEDDSGNGADRIMFCNQLISSASSTQALFVTVMNIPENSNSDFRLGNDLAKLKRFLMPLDPILRTSVINDSEYVKSVHNKTVDQINLRKYSPSDSDAKSAETALASEFWHYTIFLPDPVSASVYEMDGMGAQVVPLGITDEEDESWASVTVDALEEKFAELRGHGAPFRLFGIFDVPVESSSKRSRKRNGYHEDDSDDDTRSTSDERSRKRRKSKKQSKSESAGEHITQSHDYTMFLLEMTKLMASRGDIMERLKRTQNDAESSDEKGYDRDEIDEEDIREQEESADIESDVPDARVNGYSRERDYSDRSADYGSVDAQGRDSASVDERRRYSNSDEEEEVEIEIEEASGSGSGEAASGDDI